jgi:hypothetical protein
MRNKAIHLGGVLALVAMGALAVAVGTAGAVTSRRAAVSVPAIAVRLHADLTPVGSATSSGRFDALLIRTGPGLVRAGATLPAPRGSCPPNPRMGIPCVIGPGRGFPGFPIPAVPPTGVHWTIVWRLSLSGVTGPASASIHLGAQGAASPILATLCSSCQPVTRGHMTLTADQAQLFLKGDGYVNVSAASGELNGHIVVAGRIFFNAPVRRLGR